MVHKYSKNKYRKVIIMSKIKTAINLAVLVLLTCSFSLYAVSNDEIAKMKEANPAKPIVEPAKPRKMLMFDFCAGFKHSSIPYWAKTFDIMAEKTGAFSVEHSIDMADFNSDNLKQYDVICFNNTTSLDPTASQRKAIMDFIESGKGIVGIHAAADNFNNWEEGKRMMGNIFTGHPWTGGGTWAIKITEPDHPLTRSFAGKDFKLNDEIYRTDAPYYDRTKQRVLVSLDLSDPTTKNADGVKPSDIDTGISWIKRVGKGRLFYCSLGHTHHTTWNEAILGHYLAGIQYAIGDYRVDDSIPVTATPGIAEKADNLLSEVKQYDWDKNQKPLHEMTLFVRDCLNNSKDAMVVEVKLLTALSENVNFAVKDYICRQLAVIGSELSVPALGKMLVDPETSNIARYALERINSDKVDSVFIDVLNGRSDDKIKSGVLISLGVRKCSDAVSVIKGYLVSSNEYLVISALQALSDIGNTAAANALLAVSPSSAKDRYYDALLACGNKLAKNGNTQIAINLFEKVYSQGNDSIVKLGALISLIQTDKTNSAKLVKAALEGGDIDLQKAAIQTLSKLNDTTLLNSIASSIMGFSDNAKIMIITALSENPNQVGEAQALELTQSKDVAVRLAAYEALAKLGTVKSAGLLATIASEIRDRKEKEAVEKALYSMPGDGVDKEILNLIISTDKAGKEMVAIELIKAAVERQAEGVSKVLLMSTKSSSRRVVSSAVRALMSVANADDVSAMVSLLAENPSTSTENAVSVLAGRLDDISGLRKSLSTKYLSLNDDKAKQSFLKVMGKIGGKEIASILKATYSSSNPVLKEAAFRAMTEWPGDDFTAEMKELAKSGKDAKTRILAFRGYLRMIQSQGGDNSSKLAIEAYEMAERDDEKRMVIGAMADFADKHVLEFLCDSLDNSSFSAEAAISAVSAADKLAGCCPQTVIAAMEKVAAGTGSDSVKKQAQDVIKKVNKIGAYVVDWKISGPYMDNAVSAEQLHDRAFAPERSQGKWKPAKASDNNTINMMQVGEGDNRVGYLKTKLISPVQQEVTFAIGSDDGVKVWLNDQVVHSNNTGRGLSPRSDNVKVKLNKGSNDVFVKVTQRSGGWEFCLEVLDAAGSRVKNIEVDNK